VLARRAPPLCVLGLALLASCAVSPTPYHFRSALLAGARADATLAAPAAAPPRRRARPAAKRSAPDPRRAARAAVLAADRENARAAPRSIAVTVTAAATTDGDPLPPEELPAPIDPAALPAPHLEPERLVPHAATPGDLRAMTGARTRHDPHAFAVLAATALTARPGPDGIPTDGEYLLAWARDHATAIAPAETAPGDLLVFDRTAGDAPASLWAIALARDDRGVVEMLYVADGVVRRGFVDPAHPRLGRGADGAIHNTFLRHGRFWPPPGTRYLAGELVAHAFRLR
jgi:hypothetical protein